MSYPPSPYSPPPLQPRGLAYASPGAAVMAPLRRASVMLIVVGALSLALSLCVGATVLTRTRQELQVAIDTSPFLKNPQGLPPGVALVDIMRTFYQWTSLLGVIIGPILIVLGITVRRAGKTAIVFAVLFCGLIILLDLISMVFAFLGDSPLLFAGACMGFVPTILIGLAMGWLMQILRVLPQIDAMQQTWQTNYAGSQQQQQTYNQGSTGYGHVGIPPVNYGQQGYGYGAPPITGPPAPQPDRPPVRHPPLPPDPPNSPQG